LPTSRKPERLVVDANPILAALLGGMARRIFFETDIQEFAIPDVTITEVRGFLPRAALKIGVKRATLEFGLDLLPLRRYTARTYRQSIAEARRRIGKRDLKDVDVLALTLHLGLPLWSNDRDFEEAGIECLTTARLLALFFGTSSR
jgi:predicted nucleic acid-binding protein